MMPSVHFSTLLKNMPTLFEHGTHKRNTTIGYIDMDSSGSTRTDSNTNNRPQPCRPQLKVPMTYSLTAREPSILRCIGSSTI